MNIYKIYQLGRVVTGYTPSTANKLNYLPKKYMFVGPSDLKKSRFIKYTEKYVSENAIKNMKNKILHCGDIVIDCIGSDMGNVSVITEECISNQQINAITNIDTNIIKNLYLYYLLTTKKFFLHQIGLNGSTMPIISKSLFEEIELEIHDLKTQQHIVDTISCFSIFL